MRKTVLTFGLISGALVAIMMVATLPFVHNVSSAIGYILGYTTIVLSSLFIFFGVRSYRENVSGGRLTFARGFAVGILIALVTSACYVGTWEIVYFKFMPDFADKYAARLVDNAKASGASPEKIQKATQDAEHFKQIYNNPIINIGMTFLEIFPVGLVVTLLSAALLRKKSPTPAS
jgi:hypothetical protein